MNPKDRHALVIAVSEFKDNAIGDLPGAAVDGARMQEFLSDPAKGAFEGGVELLCSPKLKDIRTAIGDLFAQAAERSGMALVYFATHGISEGPGGLLLVPSDARLKRRTTSMLPLTAIASVLSEHRVPRTVTILDVCEAGGHLAGAGRIAADKLWADELARGASPEGHFLLAACGVRESATESSEGGQFTDLLLELPTVLGERNPAEEWVQTEVLAQAIGRAAAERSFAQTPEWSGLSVAIDVPFCRNPVHDSSYSSPHAVIGASSWSAEDRAALGPSIQGFWNAHRKIGASDWLDEARQVILSVRNLELSDAAKARFWARCFETAALRVASLGSASDRAQLVELGEEIMVRLGALDSSCPLEANAVSEGIGRLASAVAGDLYAFASGACWSKAEDGPAVIVTAPIRFWDELGRAALVCVASKEVDEDASSQLLEQITAIVADNPRLHRVVWTGQYPDLALVLGLLLRSDVDLAKSFARSALQDLVGQYSRGLQPARAEMQGVDLGRYLAGLVCVEPVDLPPHADEGAALLLLALQETGAPDVEISSLAAIVSENTTLRNLVLYVPKSVKAQCVPHMGECRVLTWRASEEGLTQFLSLSDSERQAPFASKATTALELVTSSAAGRVFRNRAVAGLLTALPTYLDRIAPREEPRD